MNKKLSGQNLKAIKESRKFTIEELAKSVGIHHSTVAKHMKEGISSIDNLLRYCEALGCEPSDLLDGCVDLENFSLERDIASFYPFNLALVVMGDKRHDDLYKVYAPGLIKAIETLTDREQKVLDLRYRNGLTLEQTGMRFNVTRERIRQVEARAIRKLRQPSRSKHWYLDTINKAFEIDAERARLERENEDLKARLAKYETLPKTKAEPKKVDIADMELSVRSYNCLKRAGINYVSDLEGMTCEKLKKVRNFGRRSIEEVVSRAREFGIEIPLEENSLISGGLERW